MSYKNYEVFKKYDIGRYFVGKIIDTSSNIITLPKVTDVMEMAAYSMTMNQMAEPAEFCISTNPISLAGVYLFRLISISKDHYNHEYGIAKPITRMGSEESFSIWNGNLPIQRKLVVSVLAKSKNMIKLYNNGDCGDAISTEINYYNLVNKYGESVHENFFQDFISGRLNMQEAISLINEPSPYWHMIDAYSVDRGYIKHSEYPTQEWLPLQLTAAVIDKIIMQLKDTGLAQSSIIRRLESYLAQQDKAYDKIPGMPFSTDHVIRIEAVIKYRLNTKEYEKSLRKERRKQK